jgi:hypothetical protein
VSVVAHRGIGGLDGALGYHCGFGGLAGWWEW